MKKFVLGSVVALSVYSALVYATQTISQDLVVIGSECIGVDCNSAENFGFDTLRLKENNLRIKFDDTSSSSSFPNNDWQLTANDSNNGGLNKFSIENTTVSTVPFTIVGSAPNNSLYVKDNGFVGIGTSTPNLNMNVKYGNSPGIRLEQDGSSGFASQSWDIAGNETNFFIRDVTNSSNIPFKIRPGASTNSLYIDTDGDVGLGTSTPDARLHVNIAGANEPSFLINQDGTANSTQLVVAADGKMGVGEDTPTEMLHIKSTNDTKILISENPGEANPWFIGFSDAHGRGFAMIDSTNNDRGLVFQKSGNFFLHTGGPRVNGGNLAMRIDNSGHAYFHGGLTVYGTFNNSSSKSLKDNYSSVDHFSILDKIAKLNISKWSYIHDTNKTLHIGPFAEEFYSLFKIGTDEKHISPIDTAGVSLSAIKALNEKLTAQQKEIEELKKLVSSLAGKAK